MNRTMLWMLAALCAASADAQPLSDAERVAILGMLSAEKPHYADVRTELNHTTDPLGSTPGYRLLGYMPSRRSCDVGKSILGIGYETLDRRTFDPKWTFPLVGGLGVKYARCQTGWMRCETERGKYDFGWLDEVVDGLAAEGVSTWLSLGFGNPLYTPCEKFEEQWKEAKAKGTVVPGWARGWVGESPWYHGEAAMKGWLAYVQALARHFKGRVKVFEIWNEPEFFWCKDNVQAEKLFGVKRSAADFAAFARVTAAAVREEIPDAEFAFNLAYVSSGWMPALAEAGIGETADIFCYHGYGRTVEESPRTTIAQAKALFRKPDGTPVRVWQGESGRATGKSRLYAFPSPYAQAKFIARRVLTDLREGAELSSIFTVTDFLAYYPDGSDQFYGIIDGKTHLPKLGYRTLQAMAYLFDGLELAPEYNILFTSCDGREFTPQDAYRTERAAMKRKGVPVFAWWRAEHLEISAAPVFGCLRFVTGSERCLIPDPIVIDPVRRKVWDVKGRLCRTDRGIDDIRPAWALDYPLVLTDLSVFREGGNLLK